LLRLDLIVKEANALGTAYLRADTIAEPQRGELKAALKEYTADRVAQLNREGRNQIEPLLAKVSGLHERMWKSAITGTQDNAPLMAVVLPPINEVIDLHSMHPAMARRHLPIPIMAVILGTAAISLGIIGFGNGRIGRRFSLIDAVYGAVLAAALWMTIDMDYPGGGMITVSNRPVVEALAAMNRNLAWHKRSSKCGRQSGSLDLDQRDLALHDKACTRLGGNNQGDRR
jgi:hypothetical protein